MTPVKASSINSSTQLSQSDCGKKSTMGNKENGSRHHTTRWATFLGGTSPPKKGKPSILNTKLYNREMACLRPYIKDDNVEGNVFVKKD
jgi:hypothetical protein